MSANFPSLPGDIIFFSPINGKSANTIAQSLLRFKKAHHSHVALVVNEGNAIHAMPKKGVHVESIRIILKNNLGNFLVYRNSTLNEKIAPIDLSDLSWYYNFQRYNYFFFTCRRSNASFCSELIARVYISAGLHVSLKLPERTLPSDIFNHMRSNNEWREVTQIYADFFLSENYPTVLEKVSSFIKRTEIFNQGMTYGQNLTKQQLEYISQKNGIEAPKIEIHRTYWTDPTRPSALSVIFSIIKSIIYRRK